MERSQNPASDPRPTSVGGRHPSIQLRAALLLFACAAPVTAQVGHLPEHSPYRDLEYAMELSFFGGYYQARKDPVGVAPGSGPMYGARYDLRLVGPTYAYARVATASLESRVVDPTKPLAERAVGTRTLPLLFSDIGLGVSLTGFKTWHSLAPQMDFGAGTTADLAGRADVAKYRFGVPFTMTFGAGVKWLPAGRWQVRGDWTSYIYQINYPNSYFIRSGTDNPVLLPGAARSLWRRNNAYQIGLSYLYHR